MSGNKIISAYTPSNTDPELLKRILVQREKLLQRTVDRLAASMTTGDKDHTLLIGPRGSGKTFLVSLVAWELQQKNELSDVMRIAWLGEDDAFSGLIHFAFAIAKALADEYPDEFPADFKADVRGLPNDDAALSVLNTTAGRYRVRALHHLAGANHRMYMLLSDFLTRDTLDDLVSAFEALAEDMTPYF